MFLSIALFTNSLIAQERSNDTLVLRDIPNDKEFPAQMMEINIPSAGAKLQGSSIQYLVWDTDHPFTNKRISLISKVLRFLEND